jgi:hypothetical protein
VGLFIVLLLCLKFSCFFSCMEFSAVGFKSFLISFFFVVVIVAILRVCCNSSIGIIIYDAF